MPIYSTKLRKSLNALIHDMALHSGDFSCRPGKDFAQALEVGLRAHDFHSSLHGGEKPE